MTAAGKSTSTAAGEVIAPVETTNTGLGTAKSAAGGYALEPATHATAAETCAHAAAVEATTHAATMEAAPSHSATKAAAVTSTATASHSRRGKHES